MGVWRAFCLAETCFEWAARIHLGFVRGGQRGARETFAKAASRLCDVFGVAVYVDDSRAPLTPEQQEIRVSNHVGYLDIISLASVQSGRFFSKIEVANWALVGRVAKEIGTVFVERGSKKGRASALKELVNSVVENPAPVVVFPEGTTNKGPPKEFYPGAFIAACKTGLSVRPITLRWEPLDEGAWVGHQPLLPNVWRRLCGDVIRVTLVVFPTLESTGITEAELSAKCREVIASGL